uniref:Uncharacterized protein n=1 Tax=Brassica oleracea var. oleracea TaxID=109376 RepID=A0A0D3DFQ6_BRAOL
MVVANCVFVGCQQRFSRLGQTRILAESSLGVNCTRKEGMTIVLTLSGLIKKKYMVGQRGL